MDILQSLRNYDSLSLPDHHFVVRAMWKFLGRSCIDTVARVCSPPSEYAFILTLTNGGMGCCYCDQEFDFYCDENWIGSDAREILTSHRTVEISILDSIYSNLLTKPPTTVILDGPPNAKATDRASIMASEIKLLAQIKNIQNPRILNIGALERLIGALVAMNIAVHATDVHPSMIGRVVSGVEIMDGEINASLIKKCDIAVVTGMTIVNGTINAIFELCKEHGTAIIMFALTGANFGWKYCALGADVVIAELFPFYIIPGQTRINIFRKRDVV